MNKKQNSKQKIQKLAENDARPERAIQPTELLNDTLRRIFGCELADATQKQVYRALCISVRELLTEKNRVFGNRCTEKERKEVYYMSMEFLVGTSLRNNLFNLGLEAEFRKALADAGFDIDEIYAIDPDAGLGNGGLGRLASCYMDAATGMDYPMTGFSIRYEFGIFKQKIVDGWQMEFPDNWLEMGDVWLQAARTTPWRSSSAARSASGWTTTASRSRRSATAPSWPCRMTCISPAMTAMPPTALSCGAPSCRRASIWPRSPAATMSARWSATPWPRPSRRSSIRRTTTSRASACA